MRLVGLLCTSPGRIFGNYVHDSYEAIVDACCAAWIAALRVPEQTKSRTQSYQASTVGA